MTNTSSGFGTRNGRSADHPYTLDVLPSNADADQYTFVPRDADDDERLTKWITADEDGIVELSAWR